MVKAINVVGAIKKTTMQSNAYIVNPVSIFVYCTNSNRGYGITPKELETYINKRQNNVQVDKILNNIKDAVGIHLQTVNKAYMLEIIMKDIKAILENNKGANNAKSI